MYGGTGRESLGWVEMCLGRIEGGVLVRFTEEFVELFWGDGRKRAGCLDR